MNTTPRKTFLALLGTGVASAALLSSPAYAQGTPAVDCRADPTNPDCETDRGASIIVTGSRIARPELESVSPVTTVGAEQIELTGTVTIESLINDLPNVIPGNNRSSNNAGGEDFATLDLRGLGPNRTLILVDGERLAASSTNGSIDVSQVPTSLIQRIDVVTGGASAVYGSDAIAGVINFILKQDYEGAEVTGQVGIAEAGVGFNFNVQGLIGGNFADGRGNVTLSASYYDRDSVGQGRFGYSRVSAALATENGQLIVADDPSDVSSPSNIIFSGGSVTNPFGSAVALSGNGFRNLGTLLPATFTNANTDCNAATPGVTVNSGTVTFDTSGRLTPNAATTLCRIPVNNSSRFNFAPLNFLSIPFNRLNLAGTARYELDDNTVAKLYTTYARSEGVVNLAPTPANAGTGFIVPADSPLIPADLRIALNSRVNPNGAFQFNRRFFETGARIGTSTNQSYQIRGIVERQISDKWSANAIASYGRTDFTSRNVGNINRSAVEAGLNGCRTGGTANPGFGVPEGCVPVNIFGFGTLTPAMVKFIQTNTTDLSRFEQVRGAVNVNGALFDIVEGDPVAVAFGAEVRKDTGSSTPDDAKVRGEIIGFNQANPLAGKIDVKEVYGEIRIPVLGGGSFPDLLAFEGGARYSDYSTVGGLFNYKLGVEFAPIAAIKFRGAYNRAARAPSVFELFQNGDQGFPTYNDPCNAAPNPPSAAVLAVCRAQAPGFDFTGFAQSNTQVQAFAFGNPQLSEEKAETYTAGVVFAPRSFPLGKFSATVDYYDIKITNLNASQGSGFFIRDCYNNNNPQSCARIVRDPATGQIDRVNTTRINSTDTLRTKGIDVGVNWVIPLDDLLGLSGRLRIAELFTYVDSYKLGGTEFAGKTFDGIGGTTSKYASTLTVGYEGERFTGQVRWVYKSGGNQDDALFGNDADAGFNTPKIPDLNAIDVSLRYKVSDHFSTTFIIENITNKFPPQTATGTFEQANSNTSFYEPYLLGRSFTMQATVKF